MLLDPQILIALQYDVSHFAGLVPQNDHESPSAFGELPPDGLSRLQLSDFGELLVDFRSGFLDFALGHILLRIGQDVLPVASELGLLSFDLPPPLGFLRVEELEGVEVNESGLAVPLDFHEDGPLDEGLKAVTPGFDELEGSQGGVGFPELLDD